MSTAAEAELRLRFVDKGATAGLDKFTAHVDRVTKQTETVVERSNARQRTSFERLSLARETLGMRSEQKIQREIQQTEAAYKRLAVSGKLSQDELTRAAEKTRQKITKLTNEMGKLTAEQQRAAKAAKDFEAAQGRIRTGVAVGAGVAAAGYALKAPVMNAMSWKERLAYMSNTAFPERDVRGKQAGDKELDQVINNAVDLKKGGAGTREQAADALNVLLGRGNLGYQGSKDILPSIMRTAYGNNANPEDIASLMDSLFAQGFVKSSDEAKKALNMITAGGQSGGFEIKDMARHLPDQLAKAKNAGMTGLAGLQKVIVMNEAGIITSGTPDQAGINVSNLLGKVSSKDTANDLKKAGRGDLAEVLIKGRLRGQDPIDVWMSIIDKEAERSPLLKSSLTKLKGSTNKQDQQAAIESINQLIQGSVIGKYFQDAQATAALFGYRNTNVTDRVNADVSKNASVYGVNDANYEHLATTGAAEMRNVEQELAIRQQQAMEKLIPTISKAAEIFTDLSQKYPALSSAVIGATPPIIALGTAAGVTALTLGGKFPAMGPTGKVLKGGLKGGAIGGAALGLGYGLDAMTDEGSALNRYGNAGLTGAAIGLGLGSVVPVIGNGTGALIGGALGMLAEGARSSKSEVHLTVESTTPGFMVKQKSKSDGVSVTTKGNTGNMFSGAPGMSR